MAVHFILGGSGRGKSYYLNHIVAARAQEEKDKTFIMLVPEQATMQVQREIVQISSNRGIMNIEALCVWRTVSLGRPERQVCLYSMIWERR